MIKLTPNADGKIDKTLRNQRSIIDRYAVSCVREGEEARQVCYGPMVPGPWACMYRLCGVIDNNGGSGKESRDRLAAGEEFYFEHGDQIEIDGVVYVMEKAPNDNTKLTKV